MVYSTTKGGSSSLIPRRGVQKKGAAQNKLGVSERIAEEKESSWIKNKKIPHPYNRERSISPIREDQQGGSTTEGQATGLTEGLTEAERQAAADILARVRDETKKRFS